MSKRPVITSVGKRNLGSSGVISKRQIVRHVVYFPVEVHKHEEIQDRVALFKHGKILTVILISGSVVMEFHREHKAFSPLHDLRVDLVIEIRLLFPLWPRGIDENEPRDTFGVARRVRHTQISSP
jgi:hypothetical protein